MVFIPEVVMVMKVVGDKLGYTLAGIEAYLMHKACRVDIDIEGMEVSGFEVERYFHKEFLSILGSIVNFEVVV